MLLIEKRVYLGITIYVFFWTIFKLRYLSAWVSSLGMENFFLILFWNHSVPFQKNFSYETVRRQGRNQEFFRAGEFSWNQGTLINISFITHERKAPQGKIWGFFLPETHKTTFFKWNIKTQDDHNQGIFSKVRTLFSNFWKRAEEILPPSPPLVTRLDVSCKKLSSWQKKVVSLYLLLITPAIINSSFTLK